MWPIDQSGAGGPVACICRPALPSVCHLQAEMIRAWLGFPIELPVTEPRR